MIIKLIIILMIY